MLRHALLFIGMSVCVAASSVHAEAEPAPSLARYEVRHGKHSERVELLRSSARIEIRYLARGITEVWERDARGELWHARLYHRAQRVVSFTPGDLRTIHLEPSWESLGQPTAEKGVRLRLLSVKPCTDALCAKEDVANYRELQFADLGDMEHDPFVRSFMASAGHHH
jgi:hypothetical protein